MGLTMRVPERVGGMAVRGDDGGLGKRPSDASGGGYSASCDAISFWESTCDVVAVNSSDGTLDKPKPRKLSADDCDGADPFLTMLYRLPKDGRLKLGGGDALLRTGATFSTTGDERPDEGARIDTASLIRDLGRPLLSTTLN